MIGPTLCAKLNRELLDKFISIIIDTSLSCNYELLSAMAFCLYPR